MLSRVFHHTPPGAVAPVAYRMDLFGGSRMKDERAGLDGLFSQAPTAANPGRLVALPVAETVPNSAFSKLARQLLPNKESFYYFQRMMLASPPDLPGENGPYDHVLEGRFELAVLPDRPSHTSHSFRIGLPGHEPLALRPHDGCGFIKASYALRMPACRKVMDVARKAEPKGIERDLSAPYGSSKPANLSWQALHHYPRNEAVANEVRECMPQQMAEDLRSGGGLAGQTLYRHVTTGRMAWALRCLRPTTRCICQRRRRPFSQCKAASSWARRPMTSPTCVRCRNSGWPWPTAATRQPPSWPVPGPAIQLRTRDDSGRVRRDGADPDMFFAKGLLVVVPDEMWPQDDAGASVMMSSEDIKTHTSWTDEKHRDALPERMSSVGILQVGQLFAPGSLVAMPVDEQKKLDGDFDGDALLVIVGRPALYQHVKQFDETEQAASVPSLKPLKTHTSAIDAQGRYRFGRTAQILATKLGVLERFSMLQRFFLAQPEETRQRFSERRCSAPTRARIQRSSASSAARWSCPRPTPTPSGRCCEWPMKT